MSSKRSFGRDFRRFFFRGLAAVLPTLLTLMIIIYVFDFVQSVIGGHINNGAYWLIRNTFFARVVSEAFWRKYLAWWIGFVIAIISVYLFGRFVASFIGRWIWRGVERLIIRTPVVRQIYPSVKQVTDFLLSDRHLDFSRVVAVEYPRKGIWSMGLMTGPALSSIRRATGCDLVTVFVPSSPTPVTGYTIAVRREEIIDLPLTIDEALRFTISGGVLMPLGQLPEGGLAAEVVRRLPQAEPQPGNDTDVTAGKEKQL